MKQTGKGKVRQGKWKGEGRKGMKKGKKWQENEGRERDGKRTEGKEW